MERYELIKHIGEGRYGSVYQAKNRQTGEIVAIKKMKAMLCSSWDQSLKLPEIRSLRKMNHPNIIKLKELILHNHQLFIVFEYMECDLFNLIKARKMKPFSESEIKHWCSQLFSGLAHLHHHGYFHRDLKPENLLVKPGIIKIADLGMAREINSQPPYTARAGSLWYRAPEVLTGTQFYGSKVDTWAMGVIMAEMFLGFALFPGSSEADQLSRIVSFTRGGTNMSKAIPHASGEAIHLMKSLCSLEPRDRPTAAQVLQYPFFRRGCTAVPRFVPLRPSVALRGPQPGGCCYGRHTC